MAPRRKRVTFNTDAGRVSFLAGGGGKLARASDRDERYRGFWIRHSFRGAVVEKEGVAIGGPYPSTEHARRVIDTVAE